MDMELTQIICPYCNNEKLDEYRSYETMHNGRRMLYKCANCKQVFSETNGSFLHGLRTPFSKIVEVLTVRSEGLGFNATCRAFNISPNTLLDWENRFAGLKDVLMLYSLSHTFLSQIIEGDELYTKIEKNVPVEKCEGWTIMLMERASRFIWELECGKKDRELFLHAMETLSQVIERTEDLTLLTDGERRYSKILFEICHEIIQTGDNSKPAKVLRKGVKVRIKNKGSQRKRQERKRAKYETPCAEHPETQQNIADEDIHANHAEAFNGSARRKNSAYRRKTNTYAKKKTGLQRTLDIFWVIHNFIRKHFTTKQV
ncbi:MAG: IS1 family transposase, partial [Gammaproteobacteria bacterium]|nr:IS1 family transposase [Gammaproteobacteria bacterium]